MRFNGFLVFLLLFAFPIAGQQNVAVKVPEGTFEFRLIRVTYSNLYGIRRDTLTGSISNNTGKHWLSASFRIRPYDAAGNEIPAQLGGTISAGELKPGENKPLNEYDLFLKGPSRAASLRLEFITGEYPANYSFVLLEKPTLGWLTGFLAGCSTRTPDSAYVETSEPVYQDSDVRVKFSVGKQEIDFTLENKTDQPITIDWNRMSYVDAFGEAHKLIHSGVKYIDRAQSLSPTTVPPNSKIEDMIFPSDQIYYSEGKYGGWSRHALFPEGPRAEAFLGKQFSVFMPLQIGNKNKDYSFRFKIKEVKM